MFSQHIPPAVSKAKVVGVSTADILELQIGAQAQSQVISFFIIGQFGCGVLSPASTVCGKL